MEKELIVKLHRNFEECAHEKDGVEFWYARELQTLLGYDDWKNFVKVIEKAKTACFMAKQSVSDHFADAGKTIQMPKGATKKIADLMLTRYACYLIAQNGDPRKDAIAFAMTYFAVQTRKYEIVEQRLADWERLYFREKLSLTEKQLSGLLFERGVDSKGFARIRSKGDEALFGGHNTRAMKEKLGVPEKRSLADFLPSVTIKAKELATEVTNFNLKRDSALTKEAPITHEHVRNNQHVREMLGKSGIRPEELPAEEDVKKLGRKLKLNGKALSRNV